jgi:hypothetical protein
MAIEPKTWTENEIVELIADTIRETQKDAYVRGLGRLTTRDIAENVFAALNDKSLIENTP